MTAALRVAVAGASGRMGRMLVETVLASPDLALAGALAAAKTVPASEGTLPTHTPLFVTVLIGTVITVGALTFVPALALGPVAEHLQLFATKSPSLF
jgi:K+-transporting ATPase ATPase A chain